MNQALSIRRIFRENPVKAALAFLFILLFVGLKLWDEYAPVPAHDWNEGEISRIRAPGPAGITFAVMGDNKGNHSIFQPLLQHVSRDKEIAFAIDVGDLVRDGTISRYRSFLSQVRKNLSMPFLAAIGNHDLDRGSRNYEEIFGPTHYAFQIGQNYFIVLGATADAGIDETERQWLEDQLKKAQSSETRLVFMHIPPFDPRGRGRQPDSELLALFRRYGVTHLFASHIHGYFSGVWDGIPYTITGGAGGRLQGSDPEHFFHHYVKVHILNGKVDSEVKRIEAKSLFVSFYHLILNDLLEWVALAGAVISLLSLGLAAVRHQAQ